MILGRYARSKGAIYFGLWRSFFLTIFRGYLCARLTIAYSTL